MLSVGCLKVLHTAKAPRVSSSMPMGIAGGHTLLTVTLVTMHQICRCRFEPIDVCSPHQVCQYRFERAWCNSSGATCCGGLGASSCTHTCARHIQGFCLFVPWSAPVLSWRLGAKGSVQPRLLSGASGASMPPGPSYFRYCYCPRILYSRSDLI